MRPHSLPNLSHELLELIVGGIEQSRDLLSLALTCKKFEYIISPNHLQFRHIRCHPCRDDIWNRLVEKPILAANVRVLELWCTPCIPLCQENVERVPRCIVEKGEYMKNVTQDFRHGGSGCRLVNAIKLMVSLQSFSWVGFVLNESVMEQIFSSLEECRVPLRALQLSHRHIRTFVPFDDAGEPPPTFPLPVKQLEFLTSLSLSNPCPCRACHPHAFYNSIVSHPGLQLRNVYLDVCQFMPAHDPSKLTKLLYFAEWPQLQRFTLKLPDFLVEDIHNRFLTDFLKRHPKLESLSLSKLGPPTLYPGMLPNLRALDFDPVTGTLKDYFLPDDVMKNLLHFGPIVEGNESTRIFQSMSSLRTCKLAGVSNISSLVTMIPNIERLYYSQPKVKYGVNMSLTKKAVNLAEDRIRALSALSLTHLGGFMVTKELEITTPRHDRLLRILANAIPTLEYVEIMHHRTAKWIEIYRDADGEYTGYRFTNDKSIHPNTWGDFYNGTLNV